MIRVLACFVLFTLFAAPVFAQDTFSWEPLQLLVAADNDDLESIFEILITNTSDQDRTYTLAFLDLPQPDWDPDHYTRGWCTHGTCAYYGIASVTDSLAAGETDSDCHIAMGWDGEISDTVIVVNTRVFDQEFPDDYIDTTFILVIGTTDVDENQSGQPMTYSLAPVYPNPFNAQTTINFTLPTPGNTVVALFDVNGRQIATLADGFFQSGNHQLTLSADDFASGTYFLRMLAGEQQFSQRMTLVK
ncbi:hypothetical protein BMS3Bbin04_01527 [bacterium BMS3Bbin04]|nr:hypothetical protein BMS3Bbin04_01527 [bacterium BMS3Bbin04]